MYSYSTIPAPLDLPPLQHQQSFQAIYLRAPQLQNYNLPYVQSTNIPHVQNSHLSYQHFQHMSLKQNLGPQKPLISMSPQKTFKDEDLPCKQELSSHLPPQSSYQARVDISSHLPPHSSYQVRQEPSSPLQPHSSYQARQDISSPLPPHSSNQAGAHPIIILPTTSYQQQYSPTVLQSPRVFHFPTPPTTPTLAVQGQVLVQRQMQGLPTIQSPSYQTPNVKTQISNPTVLFAKGLFSAQRFTEFQQFISSTSFPDFALLELRDLWLESVYSSHILKTGRSLTPMIRYRLRKRHPYPRTIWNGENTSYNVKQSSRDYLTSYYTLNPYPTAAERRIIARDTGMEYKSVSHWFKNRRSRNKGNQSTESSSDTSSNNSTLAASSELAELADSLLNN